jgi:hypothetical protein
MARIFSLVHSEIFDQCPVWLFSVLPNVMLSRYVAQVFIIIIIIIIIIIEQTSVVEKHWNNKRKVMQHCVVKFLNMINNDASFLSECIKHCSTTLKLYLFLAS